MSDLEQAANVVNRTVVESPQMLGKECIGCRRILEYAFFQRDASYRDGRRDLCDVCSRAPRLNMAEHTARLREGNYNSEAVKRQRWANQEDYRDDEARIGRPMYASDFINILRRLVPNLYFTDGRVIGDIAVYQTSGQKRPDWGGRDHKYLWYIPSGRMPEYSQYEFDDVRDIPIREKQRGWRTPLLRLIEAGLLSERVCNEVFGRAEGPASNVWYRQIQNFKNHPAAYGQ